MPLLTTGAGVYRAAAAFDPVSLYAGKKGCLYDLTNASTLFQERTGASATTPSGIDDPVGTILDLSGNSSHAIALADGNRGTRKSGYVELTKFGSKYYSTPDADIPGWNALTATTYFLAMLIENTGSTEMLAGHSAPTGAYVMAVEDGSGSGVSSGFGTPSFYIDGSLQSSPTRDTLYDALVGANHTVLITGVNPSSIFNGITWFVDNGGSNYMAGRGFVFGAIEGTLSGGDFTNMQTWLAGKMS